MEVLLQYLCGIPMFSIFLIGGIQVVNEMRGSKKAKPEDVS